MTLPTYIGHTQTKANADLDAVQASLAAAVAATTAASAQWGPTKAVGTFTGRNYTFNGGTAIVAGVPVQIAGGSLVVTDNAVSYVERTYAGVVSTNTVGFTSTSIALARVTAAAGVITLVEDWRPIFGPFPYYAVVVGEVSVVDVRYVIGDVRRHGAKFDDSTDDSGAIQAAVTSGAAMSPGTGGPFGATVTLPAGKYRCNTAIALSPNVSLQGAGMFKTILKFVNGTDGLVLEPATFNTVCGSISELQLFGTAAATTKVGVRLLNCAQLKMDRVFVAGFGINLRCRDWDHISLSQCQFGAYYGTASVVFGDVTALTTSCNGIYAHDTWVSCANATTNCAVQIDRAAFVTWDSGTIESGGVGMKIGATNPGTDGLYCSEIYIKADFENCVGKYVEIGTAWAVALYAVRGITIETSGGSISGSVNTPICVSVANTRQFRALAPDFVATAVGTAVFDFVGTNNRLAEVGPSSNPAPLAGGAWIRVNGVVQDDLTIEDRVFFGRAAFSDPLGGNQDAIRLSSQSAAVGLGAVNKGVAGAGISYAINSAGAVLFFNNVTSTSHLIMDGPTGKTIVGAAGKNLGFYGAAAVARAAAITSPTAPSAAYVQAEAQAMKTAVDAIRVALANIGITL